MKFDKTLITITEANERIKSVGIKMFLTGLFIGAVIVVLLWLTSCAPVQEAVYEDAYLTGGVYTENDTLIGIDSAYYWTKEK